MEAFDDAAALARRVIDARHKPRSVALLVALSLGLSACGGGGGSRPTPPPSGPSGGGEIDVGAGAVTVVPDSLSGSNTLVKGGAGTLVLTGTNTYSGGTLIKQGILQIGNGDTAGSITGDVTDNGTLAFNRTDDIVFDGLVSGTGGLTLSGRGAVTLTRSNTYTGLTQIDHGELFVNGDQSAATGATNVGALGTLAGKGTLGGDVNVIGGLAVSASTSGAKDGVVGNLTVNGNLTFGSGSVFETDAGLVNGLPLSGVVNVKGNLSLFTTIYATNATVKPTLQGVQRLLNYDGNLTLTSLELGTRGPGFGLQTAVNHQINLVYGQPGVVYDFWDGAGAVGNHAIEGGNGTWEAGGTSQAWTDVVGGVNSSFGNGAFAVFEGPAGTIDVSRTTGDIKVGGMQFATDGYVIRGDALNLTGDPYDPAHTTIRVGDSTLAAPNMTATIDSALTGTSGLVKVDAGTLVLGGTNTYAGGTTVDGGTLMTRYTLPGNATVSPLGRLDGVITPGSQGSGLPGVTGNLTNAGRTAVHGGDSVVGGDYAQPSTGTLAVSLGSKLSVGGTATLDGGTLEVTGADTGYASNTHTQILTATNGLTGTFGNLVKDAGVVFKSSTINYDGHSAWLDTTGLNVTTAAAGNGVSYTAASLSSAERVQGALTQLNTSIASGNPSGVSSDFLRAAGEFQQAPTLQAAQASLQSLSGQLHAAGAAMTFQAIDASGRALADHFDSVLGNTASAGTWTQNFNLGGDMGRTGYDGVGFQLNGWLVGSDRQIGPGGIAGFAFGQSVGQQQLDQSYDHNRSRSTEGMLYAGWLNGQWYTQGRVAVGQFRQDVSRQLLLGNDTDGVSTSYDGTYNVAYGETGLHLDVAGTRVMPYVNAEYTSIHRDGFTESGAGGFGLRAGGQVIDRWQGGAGLRANHHWALDGGRGVDFSAGAQFRRTLASHGDVFDASFVGLPQWQPLAGIGLSRYSSIVNLGLNATLSARTRLDFAYDYEKGQRDQAQAVSARLNVAL
ncbi:autotransporter domain-containing protein [Bacillus sp. NP157]|nr:autotransporter domain-containing protein [Bacillus sp. NP157]